jgi:hypothetical protein
VARLRGLIEMSAVSMFADLATMMMWGPAEGRRAGRWRMSPAFRSLPADLGRISEGSSAVAMFTPGLLSRVQQV